MNPRITRFWTFVLCAWFAHSLAHADDAAELPDQYAEAVLNVEGMT